MLNLVKIGMLSFQTPFGTPLRLNFLKKLFLTFKLKLQQKNTVINIERLSLSAERQTQVSSWDSKATS